MKSATAESIAFKLIGYYCLIQAVMLFCTTAGQIYSLVTYGQAAGPGFLLLWPVWFLCIAAMILLGVFLIGKGRLRTADKLDASDAQPQTVVSPGEIQTIAFSILGAYFFISAFPEFLRALMILVTAMSEADVPYGGVMAERIFSRFGGAWNQYFKTSWPGLAKLVIEMAIGAFLFYKGSLLSAHWMRRSQMNPAPSD